jgi:hypothetical protein
MAVRPVVHLSFSMDCRFICTVGPNGEILVCNINDEAEPVKETMRLNAHVVDCEMRSANAVMVIVSWH